MNKNRGMRLTAKAIFVMLAFVLLTVPVAGYRKAQAAVIQDAKLAANIEQLLPGGKWTPEALAGITELDIDGQGIASLNGIEQLSNLKVLRAKGNAISDLAPVAKLRRLSHLDVRDNRLTGLAALAGNSGLASVFVSGNPLKPAAMKQIVSWKNKMTAVLYTQVSIPKSSRAVTVNNERVQLEQTPVTKGKAVYYELREIAALANIGVAQQGAKLTLTHGGMAHTINLTTMSVVGGTDKTLIKSTLLKQSGRIYVQLRLLGELFPIYVTNMTGEPQVYFEVTDPNPLFMVTTMDEHHLERVGFIDRTGKLVIPFRLWSAYPFSEGVASVYTGERGAVMNKRGDVISGDENGSLPFFFHNGIGLEASYEDKNTYWNIAGEQVNPPQGAISFTEGLARFEQNGKYGYVDIAGRIVVKPTYSWAGPFAQGVAAVRTADGTQSLLLNAKGERVAKLPYSAKDETFGDGLILLVRYPIKGDYVNAKYGYADRTGKIVIPMNYDHALTFSEGKAVVYTKDQGYAVIDTTGKTLFKLEAGLAPAGSGFEEGLLPVVRNRKVGFVNDRGKLVIPARFGHAESFHNGLARVIFFDPYIPDIPQPDGPQYEGYIDRSGKYVYGPARTRLTTYPIYE